VQACTPAPDQRCTDSAGWDNVSAATRRVIFSASEAFPSPRDSDATSCIRARVDNCTGAKSHACTGSPLHEWRKPQRVHYRKRARVQNGTEPIPTSHSLAGRGGRPPFFRNWRGPTLVIPDRLSTSPRSNYAAAAISLKRQHTSATARLLPRAGVRLRAGDGCRLLTECIS
jgi:hypothetical protein